MFKIKNKISIRVYYLFLQLAKLYKLINSEEIASIEYNRDIYRNLFVDNDVEQIEIEGEIKHKKKVLEKQPYQGKRKKP